MPHLFGPLGAVVTERIREESNWSARFDGVSNNFLARAKLSPPEALRRMYPYAFGWAPDQIKPWESPYQIAWGKTAPMEIVPQAFGYTLGRMGLGTLIIRGRELQLEFTAQQFESWNALRSSGAERSSQSGCAWAWAAISSRMADVGVCGCHCQRRVALAWSSTIHGMSKGRGVVSAATACFPKR